MSIFNGEIYHYQNRRAIEDDVANREHVQQVLASLTERQREAVLLRLQGFTQEEIGERLGINQSNVSRRISGAMGQIRAAM